MSMLVALTIKNYYFYYVVCAFCTVPGLLFDKCLFTETFEDFYLHLKLHVACELY